MCTQEIGIQARPSKTKTRFIIFVLSLIFFEWKKKQKLLGK